MYLLACLQKSINFDYFQEDGRKMPSMFAAQPYKANCSKCVICLDKAEKSMSCGKTEGLGLN